MRYNASFFHKRSFDVKDFSYSVNQFEQLAKDFAKTGVTFTQRGGHSLPLLTPKDWVTFHVLFKKTLFNVLNHLVQSPSIEFNRYEDCGTFCKFIFSSWAYEQLGFDSPKCILMMRCGVFAGSYILESTTHHKAFNLSYAGRLRPVAFHCVVAYVPTLNGDLNKTIASAPRVVDVLTEFNNSPSPKAKTLDDYVRFACSTAPGRETVLKQGLHCEVLVHEKDPTKTFPLGRSTGCGYTASLITFFRTERSAKALNSFSRETLCQFDDNVNALPS